MSLWSFKHHQWWLSLLWELKYISFMGHYLHLLFHQQVPGWPHIVCAFNLIETAEVLHCGRPLFVEVLQSNLILMHLLRLNLCCCQNVLVCTHVNHLPLLACIDIRILLNFLFFDLLVILLCYRGRLSLNLLFLCTWGNYLRKKLVNVSLSLHNWFFRQTRLACLLQRWPHHDRLFLGLESADIDIATVQVFVGVFELIPWILLLVNAICILPARPSYFGGCCVSFGLRLPRSPVLAHIMGGCHEWRLGNCTDHLFLQHIFLHNRCFISALADAIQVKVLHRQLIKLSVIWVCGAFLAGSCDLGSWSRHRLCRAVTDGKCIHLWLSYCNIGCVPTFSCWFYLLLGSIWWDSRLRLGTSPLKRVVVQLLRQPHSTSIDINDWNFLLFFCFTFLLPRKTFALHHWRILILDGDLRISQHLLEVVQFVKATRVIQISYIVMIKLIKRGL